MELMATFQMSSMFSFNLFHKEVLSFAKKVMEPTPAVNVG